MSYKLVIPILFFLLVGFDTKKEVLFKNEKVIIYMVNGGLRLNYLVENFDEEETLNIDYIFYTDTKEFLGTESITSNQVLISELKEKYKQIAKLKSKQDVEIDKNKYKVVIETKMDKMYFYYYNVLVCGNISFKNLNSSNNINDSMWHFVGANKFIVDIKINDKQVLSKKFDLEKL